MLTNRIKSLTWRAGGMAVIALGAYYLQIGDVFALDPHTMINLSLTAFVGLVVGEITKWLNS